MFLWNKCLGKGLSKKIISMKKLMAFTLLLLGFALTTKAQAMENTIYQFTMKSIDGKDIPLSEYKGKTVLIVNVASECGLTPQYADLQELYAEYKENGLVILGFPANNFGAQEPGTDAEIASFCSANFNVTFPMFSKISVKGDDQHDLYQWLTHKDQNGVLDAEMQWNFQKFLVNSDGELVAMIPPVKRVTDEEVNQQIISLLNQ